MNSNNVITSNNPKCRVVFHKWEVDILHEGLVRTQPNSNSIWVKHVADYGVNKTSAYDLLSRSKAYDLSGRILSFNYQKNMSNPSGLFSFSVAGPLKVEASRWNDKAKKIKTDTYTDWLDFIRTGSWVTIELSNDNDLSIYNDVTETKTRINAQRVRCVGYIERVSVKTITNSVGVAEDTFMVYGKDFGAIYENTELYTNMFQFDSLKNTSLINANLPQKYYRINELMDLIHDLFFSKVPTSLVKQWLMPTSLLTSLRIVPEGTPFFGSIKEFLNFKRTSMVYMFDSAISFANGIAWTRLKEFSVSQFHELFTEINDNGIPQLNFRPIPWAINSTNYPDFYNYSFIDLDADTKINTSEVAITKYKDLTPVNLNSKLIDTLEIGLDEHNRFNHFQTTVDSSLFTKPTNISYLADGAFPKQNESSVTRHGFKPLHTTVATCATLDMQAGRQADPNLLIQMNYLLYDYWNYSVQANTGSINTIGCNAVKIGRALVIDWVDPTIKADPDSKPEEYKGGISRFKNTRFYIEGYTDTFSVEANGSTSWNQSIFVTNGYSEEKLKEWSKDFQDFTAKPITINDNSSFIKDHQNINTITEDKNRDWS